MPKARTKSKLPIEIAARRAASSHVCTQTSDPRFTAGLHSTNVGAGYSCHSTGTDHLRSRAVPLHPVWHRQWHASEWVVQRLREAFSDACPYRYVILDHDSKFNGDVITWLKATGLQPKRTRVQAPWQNGIAERWVGSCRREILDHVIALDERHLRRLIRAYVNYHHEDRIHDALGKDTPNRRRVETRPSSTATLVSSPRLGGLHHRYSYGQEIRPIP